MITLLDDAEHWLSRAEETRTIAEIMTDAEARRIMFDIAEGYDRLAERAVERNGTRKPICISKLTHGGPVAIRATTNAFKPHRRRFLRLRKGGAVRRHSK